MSCLNLENKVVVITGASMGIGEALALRLARKKARLVLGARSHDRLEKLCSLIREQGGTAVSTICDVTKLEDIRKLRDVGIQNFSEIDIWVNNAGFGVWSQFHELPMEVIRSNFETNLFGAVQCMKEILPHFRERRQGMIVNVESIVSLRSMPGCSTYAATKHALHAFSESVRVELKKENVHILSVCPGLIASNFRNNRVLVGGETEPGPSWLHMSAEKCADQMIRAMEKRKRQIVITGHAKLIEWLQRLSPRILDWGLGMNYRKKILFK
jgi:short-subunit dehydrogenase